MDTIFIVTEANEYVATGHLLECVVCAEGLLGNGYAVSFWINDDADSGMKERIPCQFHEYHHSVEKDYGLLTEELFRIRPKAVLFNLREISEVFLEALKEKILCETVIICIDEFGHRHLAADIIVNPMIDSYYWNYGESSAHLFCGAEYLILPKELEGYHQKEKMVNSSIQTIVITMGGVDPRNYTSDLIEIVPEYFPDAVINVVVGGGNLHYEDIIRKADMNGEILHNKMMIMRNIPHAKLLKMVYDADLVFCAGGNTLHEAACIGTPAVIMPSMPHEVRTAECFEKKGFGIVVPIECNRKEKILKILDYIKSYPVRKDMSVNGKKVSDGMGEKRMIKLIREWIN